MKRRAKLLLARSLDSVLLAIDHFNRPWAAGRQEAVLIFLDRAFELLLKASIVERGGKIRETRAKETIGFDKCVRKCLTDASIGVLHEDQAVTVQVINSLRDAAQHYLLDISEQELYVFSQAGVTVYSDILRDVFSQELSHYLPHRVLPISTVPPTDLHAMFDAEFKEIARLVQPRSRKRVEARAKLRALAILESSLSGVRSQAGDAQLRRLVAEVQRGKDWRDLFPGVAALEITSSGEGPSFSIRLTKREGEAVHLVPEGTPGAAVIAVKRVSELDYYSLGLHDLAEKVGVSAPKALALVRHLGLQGSTDFFKEITIGKSRHKRYSPKALDAMKKALPQLDMDEVWRQHRPRRRKSQ
jgi:hypothetical protein